MLCSYVNTDTAWYNNHMVTYVLVNRYIKISYITNKDLHSYGTIMIF